MLGNFATVMTLAPLLITEAFQTIPDKMHLISKTQSHFGKSRNIKLFVCGGGTVRTTISGNAQLKFR